MKLPKEGDFITIQSYKHDGSLHRTWRDTMVLKLRKTHLSASTIILSSQRAMVEDGLQESQQLSTFIRSTGSISSLWYEDNEVSYYCNLASPYYMDQEALKYIDYDLDVKVFPDGDKKLLDVEEYEQHKRKMNYSDDIDFILKENVKITCRLDQQSIRSILWGIH